MASIRVKRIPVATEPTWGRRHHGDARTIGETGRWIVRLARLGYLAKGVLYLVIGGLAALAAIGSGGKTTGSHGALAVIGGSALGHALLLVLGAGLIGYALWAVIAAGLDAERRGQDGKGIALRVGLAARGLAYGALGVEALRLFLSSRVSSGNGEVHWTARILAMPFGQWLVGAAGAAIISYALYQFWRAARKNLRKRLHLGDMGAAASVWVLRLARFGIAARGVVFVIIGWFVVQAALRYDPNRAGGVEESLRTLASQPHGLLLLGVVAAGLVAYGVWELVNARYREMRVG